MIVLSVYDVKVEAYLQPFFLRTKGEAIRSFQQACQDENMQFAKSPEDFTLFQIGEYDESKGELTNFDAKIPLAQAIEFTNNNQ